ncbi:MAG: dihydroorotate dehydrogenase electron transfer subunit [Lachnospiraceae bacterium]|nr:dihydroorotate dehydrogenase electron transfer subunit [Lachnospiraceae bacterium]
MKKTNVIVTGKSYLAPGIISLWIKEEEMAKEAKPGQFLSIYCRDKSRLLPRPISICDVDPENGVLRVVFRIAGAGTEELSKAAIGDLLSVLGPLGNGYDLREGCALLIGGGIGIPPMLFLAKELSKELTKEQMTVVLGYRDQNLFLAKEFEAFAEVVIATDDGSVGIHGTVIDAVVSNEIFAEQVYACGPTPMLRGVKTFAEKAKIPAQISLEEHMACGIGACLACVCQSNEVDTHTNVKNKRICKDGPVFDSEEVILA